MYTSIEWNFTLQKIYREYRKTFLTIHRGLKKPYLTTLSSPLGLGTALIVNPFFDVTYILI